MSTSLIERPTKKKDISTDKAYTENFKYKHNNPYHDKLKSFDDFVLRDNEAEANRGNWNIKVFQNEKTLNCEIGTGYGHFMHDFCLDHPEENFVGLDYRFKRSFNLARKLSKIENRNFKYLRAKGERLEFIFGEEELDKVFYFFPDPWPKARHNKKRLFQKPFLDANFKVLKKGGRLFVKTDHDGYFDWMLEKLQDEINKENRFEVELNTFDLHAEYPDHFLAKYITKFEKIFLNQNIKIKALVLRKRD